jgi:hypothetical protein
MARLPASCEGPFCILRGDYPMISTIQFNELSAMALDFLDGSDGRNLQDQIDTCRKYAIEKGYAIIVELAKRKRH